MKTGISTKPSAKMVRLKLSITSISNGVEKCHLKYISGVCAKSSVIMTIKFKLYKFFRIDSKITDEIPWP
jgi:hypothetical protein